MDQVVVIDTDNATTPIPGASLIESRSNVFDAKSRGTPLVTVIILAYNRLEKTKRCVESFIKHSTDVEHDLVLIDSGSTDGTLDYFKAVEHPNKKVIGITKNLGAASAMDIASSIKSKYICTIMNDVVLTPRFLSNLLKCAQSDKTIGMVVPCSSNVSNFQSLEINFNSIDELYSVADKYNISNPTKWHQRLRLINVVSLLKTECVNIIGNTDYGFFHDFADDDITFRVRRAGYKAILCMDTFVHHDHAVSAGEDKDIDVFNKSLEIGRANFIEKYYGVDAWGDVNNYEWGLIDFVEGVSKNCCILGIDVLCGTPLLEIKNKLRQFGVYSPKLCAFTTDAKHYLDLCTFCSSVFCDRIEYLLEHTAASSVDIAIIGRCLNSYDNPQRLLLDAVEVLKPGGQLLLKLFDAQDIKSMLSGKNNSECFNIIDRSLLSIEYLERVLYDCGGIVEAKVISWQEKEVAVIRKIEQIKRELRKIKCTDEIINSFGGNYWFVSMRAKGYSL